MSRINKKILKRKTLKLNHPNPLFEKWLQEWKDEAASRNSDTQYAFAKALVSLKKYPLPLKTGKECLILENFGTRICLLLDRKLTDYNKTYNGEKGSHSEDVHRPVEENESTKFMESRSECSKELSKSLLITQKSNKLYCPTLRSASYAVLVALYEDLKKAGSTGEMTKIELQKAAQPLCDTSMFKPLPGSYYSGWSCVGQLVKEHLIRRSGNPHRYSLTEEGKDLAAKLPIIDSNIHFETSPYKKNTIQRTISNNRNKTKWKSPIKKLHIEESEILFDIPQPSSNAEHFPTESKDCLSQKSSSTLASECEEEIIFLPGSFTIVLLVDTQEIHKGDELVKALQSQGVMLEVRKLKIGDFVWVSRNASGEELLLPFIIERKRLDDLASSIKDGRFHDQKFRMKQCGVSHCMYLVESHGHRQYSMPTSTLLQAAANTQFIDKFTVKYTANSHESVVYLATFSKVINRKLCNKTLIGCQKNMLATFDMKDDCLSLMPFKVFNKTSSSKTRKYCVKEMFIKHLVQLRGLSVEKALAIVDRYPSPRNLSLAFENEKSDKLLADIPVGNLNRKIGPVISRTIYELYNKTVLS